jgi:transcriptional regulator with XRE-family HTH domain
VVELSDGERNQLETICRDLRELRHQRGATLVEVAEATRLSPSSLSLIERGLSDFGVTKLARLANYYGTQIEHLLRIPVDRHGEPLVR